MSRRQWTAMRARQEERGDLRRKIQGDACNGGGEGSLGVCQKNPGGGDEGPGLGLSQMNWRRKPESERAVEDVWARPRNGGRWKMVKEGWRWSSEAENHLAHARP